MTPAEPTPTVLVWHVGSEPTRSPLHAPSPPGHRAAWEQDPSVGDAYSRPSLHPDRRGREVSDVDADRPGLDAWYANSARRRPPGVDIQHVIDSLGRISRRARPDPVLLAVAAATAELCFRGQQIPRGLMRMFAKPSVRQREPFAGTASALATASAPVAPIGSFGSNGLDRAAESRGRTRASRWHYRPAGRGQETECRPSRNHSARVGGVAAVEAREDARRVIQRSQVTEIDREAVADWIVRKLPLPERLLRYRERLSGMELCGGPSAATNEAFRAWQAVLEARAEATATKDRRRLDKAASAAEAAYAAALAADQERHGREVRWATRDVTDTEIRRRISDARDRIEAALRRMPDRAEQMTAATGDRSWMMGLIPGRS